MRFRNLIRAEAMQPVIGGGPIRQRLDSIEVVQRISQLYYASTPSPFVADLQLTELVVLSQCHSHPCCRLGM